MTDTRKGQPGEPGKPAKGPVGGSGGTGGHGGYGQGERGERGRRGQSAFGLNQLLVYLACFAAIFYTFMVNKDQNEETQKLAQKTEQISKNNRKAILLTQAEGIARRDQTCRGWEQAHATEVRDLERSYEFYEDPPPELAALSKSPFAAASLMEDVRDAKNDRDGYGQFVPPYCDKRGVGSKEPDPALPKQPPAVKKLLKDFAASVEQSASP